MQASNVSQYKHALLINYYVQLITKRIVNSVYDLPYYH